MTSCKTCKHWQQNTNYEHGYNYGYCENLPQFMIEPVTRRDYGIIAALYDKYETSEKFGCVRWEKR